MPRRSSRDPAFRRRAAVLSRPRRVSARQSAGPDRPRDRPRLRPRTGGRPRVARPVARDRALRRGGARPGPEIRGRRRAARNRAYRAGRQRFGRVSAGSPGRLVGRGRSAAISPDRERPATNSVHGERALARLVRADSGEVEAEIIRRVARPEDAANRVVGVFRRTRDGGVIAAADRRDKTEYRVIAQDAAGLPDGELVVAEEMPSRRFGKHARILERLGPADAPDAISRLTIAAFDIPAEFPEAALAEADSARSAHPSDPRRERPRRSARSRAGHDRRRGRARFRRRGLGRTRSGPGQSGRLAHRRRDRRCLGLCRARKRARRRGGAARQLGLFPGPRRADAARGAVERSVLAAAGRGSPLRRGASVDRFAGPQAPPPFRARGHALGGTADLRGCAGRPRRQTV